MEKFIEAKPQAKPTFKAPVPTPCADKNSQIDFKVVGKPLEIGMKNLEFCSSSMMY
jgi:hypothetical protein